VRALAPKAVEPEKVVRVLAAANTAPSAGNLQGYEIFQVTGEKERVALARAALEQLFVVQAPVVNGLSRMRGPVSLPPAQRHHAPRYRTAGFHSV